MIIAKKADITDDWKIYSCYYDIFNAAGIDSTGFNKGWSPLRDDWKNWDIIWQGPHPTINVPLYVLQKIIDGELHKIVIDERGVVLKKWERVSTNDFIPMREFTCDIISPGKSYTTYERFFDEQGISKTNWEAGWDKYSETGYTDWRIIHCGKHRSGYDMLFIIEKDGHRVIIGEDGIRFNHRGFYPGPYSKSILPALKQFEFNDIWSK